MINIKREAALLGLRTVVDLLKTHKTSHFKVRDRYYLERSKAIRKRGESILSTQKVLLAKGGVYKSAVLRETKAQMELDLMALIHEDEVVRYNAAIR
jgi:predicted acetyltransferase